MGNSFAHFFYTLPNKSGTIACTDDIPDALSRFGGTMMGGINMDVNNIT